MRTRPSDEHKVLVTEDEVELIKEQWSIVDGRHSKYLAQKKRGRTPEPSEMGIGIGGGIKITIKAEDVYKEWLHAEEEKSAELDRELGEMRQIAETNYLEAEGWQNCFRRLAKAYQILDRDNKRTLSEIEQCEKMSCQHCLNLIRKNSAM
jgi:hypothetical protein